MPSRPLPTVDLDHTLLHSRPAFDRLRNASLFLTGATGFFGHALLEPLLHASDTLHLGLRANVLTRNTTRFRAHSPHIAHHPAVTLLEGDVITFTPPSTPFTHIVHGAADSTGPQDDAARTILDGTRRTFDLAAAQPHPIRFLFLSSGAVYGRSTPLPFTPETYIPEDPTPHPYDDAKRAAEALCLDAARAHPHIQPVLARCFAFVGPHLPLDAHFAIGNFLGAALAGRPIEIRGDGTPRRSWLHTADLAVWLWTLLTHGAPGRAYNVGSDEAYTIAGAARLTADTLAPGLSIHIAGTPDPTANLNSYVPDITRARTELNLTPRIPLHEALQRTAAWHRS